MTVSVIIPTYNYAAYVGEAIESVLAQTVQDFQLIVVDDGSTDNTPEVLSSFNDPRIEIVRTPNGGICAACNEGLARARGEFIGFLGADDRWRPQKLERQIRMMEAEPGIVAVMTNFVRFDERGFFPDDQFAFFPELQTLRTTPTRDGRGNKVVGDAFCEIVSFVEFPTWSGVLLFRRSAVDDLKFARQGLHRGTCGDLHFALRAFRRGSIGFIAEPLVEVRRHGANATSRSSEMPTAKLAALSLLTTEELTSDQRAALSRRIGRALIEVGLQRIEDGQFREAGRAFARASRFPGGRVLAAKGFAILGMSAVGLKYKAA
jgi:glycosyltransferase involved in cell wall biosynthesis